MPVIDSDKAAIEKVMYELISNAIMHNQKQTKEVTVSVTQTNTCYCFQVKDNGDGIESKYFEKIFIIFQTLQARDEHESCGIGLSIAKKIASDLGGSIHVESDLGKGSVFSFTIPKNHNNKAKKMVMQRMLEE